MQIPFLLIDHNGLFLFAGVSMVIYHKKGTATMKAGQDNSFLSEQDRQPMMHSSILHSPFP